MNRLNKLEVFYHERLVGTIACNQNRLAAFEYDSNLAGKWIFHKLFTAFGEKSFIPKDRISLRDFLAFLQIVCLMDGADCWLIDL